MIARLMQLATGNPVTLLWIAVGIAAVSFAAGGSVAWKVQGWRLDAANAKHAEFKTKVEAAREIQIAENAKKDAEHSKLIAQKDIEHDKDVADASAYWADYAWRMRADADRRSGAAKKSVPIASKICNNEAADNRLSDAIERARQDVRRAIAEYREGLARLFGAAEVQTLDLVNAQAWAADEAKIETGGP